MGNVTSLEDIIRLAKQLSPRDKLRLIEKIVPQIECDLRSSSVTVRKSLRGLWRGLDISSEDISEARREMWAGFPREEI